MKRLLIVSVSVAALLVASPAEASRSEVLTPKPRVTIPPTLRKIRWCESRDNYRAQNRRSSASGAYQILRGTWASWSKAYGRDVGATRYRRAKDAPPYVQDVVAVRAFQKQGTRPWAASRRCWR